MLSKKFNLLLSVCICIQLNAQNLVPNPQFELLTPATPTYTFYNPQMECYRKGCTEMEDLFRPSPAQHWTMWLGANQKNACVMTELVKAASNCVPPNPNYVMSNMMHVKTTFGGMGIVNDFVGEAPGTYPAKISCWVYVIKGKVYLGYGPTGGPVVSVVSKSLCKWEKLEVTKAGKESCNQVVLYANNQKDAEFYVDAVSVIKIK